MTSQPQNNVQFTFDLYKQIAADSNDNIFISPLSISFALGLVLAGAKENNNEQIKKVLNLESFESDIDIHQEFHNIINSLLESEDSAVKVHIANRMYVNTNNANVLPDYKTTLKKYYDSTSKEVDFGETEKIRLEINNWVEAQTNEKIKDLIAPGLLSQEMCLVLVNAIYFKGNWKHEFDPKYTRRSYFFIEENKAIKTDLMHLRRCLKCVDDERDLRCRLLELPYKNEAFSMYILFPIEVNGFKQLEESITASKLNEMLTEIDGTDTSNIILTFPKFRIESSMSLNDILTNMGISDLFSQEDADLSGISGEKNLFCSAAVHKTFLEVDECGTEAAAGGGMLLMLSTFNPYFRVDRPFILFIRDNRTDVIIFWGRVLNPNPGAKIKEIKREDCPGSPDPWYEEILRRERRMRWGRCCNCN